MEEQTIREIVNKNLWGWDDSNKDLIIKEILNRSPIWKEIEALLTEILDVERPWYEHERIIYNCSS